MSDRVTNRTVTLADLVALNEEIAALVRAGTPLEQGLVDLGEELPGRLGDLASQLGQRLQAGEEITRVLADDSLAFPPVWRAMVTAGVRSGRLSSVLESLAATGRRTIEMQRAVTLSVVYPTVVCVLAYGVAVGMATFLAPGLSSTYRSLTIGSEPLLDWFTWLGQNVIWWVAWPPLIALSLLVVEAIRQRSGKPGPVTSLLLWCWPGTRRAYREARLATFTEILSMLTRAQLPMPEALRLAGNACCDGPLRSAAIKLSDQVARGEVSVSRDTSSLAIPPLLGLMVATGSRSPAVSDALAWTAQRYRERSMAATRRLAMILPIVLSAGVGGLAVALTSLTVFWPIWQLLRRLGG